MSRATLLLLLSLLAHNLFSQFYIKGKVVDDETQQPLKGASVYINNSTRGTTTDEKGEFQLGPFDAGRYDVVASYVGYEALLYSAEIKEASFRINFQMDKKGALLSEVLVLPEALRRKYLEILKKNILGFTDAAERCRIRNMDEVEFIAGDSKDEIKAYTDGELVIENPDLGYTIYFQLIEFYFNKSNSTNYFFGYTRFVDKEEGGPRKKFIRRRSQAYLGSTMHFFRSLVNKELTKEGFSVTQVIMNEKKKDSLQANNNTQQKIAIGTKTTEDSMIRIYPDSLYRIYELRIGDGWRINYNGNTELKNQLLKKSLGGFQPPLVTVCGLRLKEPPALVNEKGLLLTPSRLYLDGIWAYERLANLLPDDYKYYK
jgi:hypothetical protein